MNLKEALHQRNLLRTAAGFTDVHISRVGAGYKLIVGSERRKATYFTESFAGNQCMGFKPVFGGQLSGCFFPVISIERIIVSEESRREAPKAVALLSLLGRRSIYSKYDTFAVSGSKDVKIPWIEISLERLILFHWHYIKSVSKIAVLPILCAEGHVPVRVHTWSDARALRSEKSPLPVSRQDSCLLYTSPSPRD
jgi:hypothetical protein